MASATGFLGSYIVEDLLERKNIEMIMCAESKTSRPPSSDGRDPSAGYGVWQDSWADRLSAVIGDLSQPYLGLDDKTWDAVVNAADAIIHNGAHVHWIQRYKHPERSNVLSTLDALRLCN